MVGEVEDTELSFPNMWKKVVSGRCLIVPKEDKEGGAKAAAATQQDHQLIFFFFFLVRSGSCSEIMEITSELSQLKFMFIAQQKMQDYEIK